MNSINTTKQMIYITNLSNITDNWDISRLEHDFNFIFWMNVYRMIVPRNPWRIFPDHNKRVWIGKGRRNEAGKGYVKDGLFVTGSVWVKRKCLDHATIDSNGNPHVLRKFWANAKSKPCRILVNLVMT